MGVICFVCGAMFGGLAGTVSSCVWCRWGAGRRGNKKDLSD